MAKNNTDSNKENKKPLFRRILVAFFFIDLIVGVIFLICYFNGCGPFNRNTSSSSSSIAASIDNTDYQQLDNKFKHLVKTQMEYDGFGSEEVDTVVAVTYVDNAPTSFSIRISATSNGYLYNLNIKGVQYKEGTDTVVSYLLCNNEIEGATNLYREQITGEHVLVPTGRYIISVPISGTTEHKTGYELIDNNFHVRQLTEYSKDSSGEFNGYQTVVFEEGQPLYNYYLYLLDR